MRHRPRQINPLDMARGIRERRLGAIPESALRREDERLGKYDRSTPLILTSVLGAWFRENIGSVGAGNYGMRLMTLDSTTTLVASGTGLEKKMGSPGRIWGGELYSSAPITAGNGVLGVQLDSSTVIPLSDAVLNTTNPRTITYRLGWKRGIPFAVGQTIEPVIIADGSFAPTTADMTAWLWVAFEEPA